jgi:predicted GNAT family N-acyltransferase
MEIITEHKQVALIEIDIVDRKYHTWHDLHFNKLGKLLFSNKLTQTIYSTLGKKLKQSIVMSENRGSKEVRTKLMEGTLTKDTRTSETMRIQ